MKVGTLILESKKTPFYEEINVSQCSFILHSQDLGPVKSYLYYKGIKVNQNLST
jgi:hypothetical protein